MARKKAKYSVLDMLEIICMLNEIAKKPNYHQILNILTDKYKADN